MKELYRELDLEGVYARYEEETHKQIKELIAKVDHIPHAVRLRWTQVFEEDNRVLF